MKDIIRNYRRKAYNSKKKSRLFVILWFVSFILLIFGGISFNIPLVALGGNGIFWLLIPLILYYTRTSKYKETIDTLVRLKSPHTLYSKIKTKISKKFSKNKKRAKFFGISWSVSLIIALSGGFFFIFPLLVLGTNGICWLLIPLILYYARFSKYKYIYENITILKHKTQDKSQVRNYSSEAFPTTSIQDRLNYVPHTKTSQITSRTSGEYIICPSCSSQMDRSNDFCNICGANLSEIERINDLEKPKRITWQEVTNPTIIKLKNDVKKWIKLDKIDDEELELYHENMVSAINSANPFERKLIYKLFFEKIIWKNPESDIGSITPAFALFFLPSEENIIISFPGALKDKHGIIGGRFYLTPSRLFIIGIISPKSGIFGWLGSSIGESIGGFIGESVGEIIGESAGEIIKMDEFNECQEMIKEGLSIPDKYEMLRLIKELDLDEKLFKELQKDLDDESFVLHHNMFCYPIKANTSVHHKKKSISYKLEHFPEVGKIKIIPSKKKRRDKILRTIKDVLIKAQVIND
jgi:hypothetical protein